MNEVERELRQVVMELLGITSRLAKIAGMNDEEIIDILERKKIEKKIIEKVEEVAKKSKEKKKEEYKDKHKKRAGMLYCDLNSKLFLEDIVKALKKEYGIKVSTATVSKWVDEYVHKNLGRLMQAQKYMIIIKKVIELDGWKIDDIANLIKERWGYKVTHTKLIKLVSSYKKIKENDKKIREMIDEGISVGAIAGYFKVPRDMIKLLYRRDEDGE